MNNRLNQNSNNSAKNLTYIIIAIFIIIVIIVIILITLKFTAPMSRNKIINNYLSGTPAVSVSAVSPSVSPAILIPETSLEIVEKKKINNKVVFGNMTAFVKAEKGYNYMILSQNGIEIIIDEGKTNPIEDNGKTNISNLGVFSDPKFSPDGNYLIYNVTGWEAFITAIYDIKNKVMVPEKFSSLNGFIEDEKYFYNCEDNAMWGEFYGRVYSIPDFKVVYEAPFSKVDIGSVDLSCEYDKTKQVVRFTIFNRNTKTNNIFEYSIINNKSGVK